MSNSIVKATQKAVVNSEGKGLVPAAGGVALGAGLGSLAVMGAAFLLPGGPLLWAILFIALGGFLAFK